jgi:hemolysin activation/secretion protein
MDESERPSKNLIVIITDGGENSSTEYRLKEIKDKIKEQTEKYNWDFIYLGNDLSDAKDANDIGIKYRGFTTKNKFYNNYDVISTGLTAYRCAATAADATLAFDASIEKSMTALNEEYKADTGIDLTNSGDKASTTEKKFGSMDFDEFKKRFDYNQWE